MIWMAERDIKKYIEPSNKETENILFHSWMWCHVLLFLWFSQCVNVNECVDVWYRCVCMCVLPTPKCADVVSVFEQYTGLWLWWILYFIQQCAWLYLKPHGTPHILNIFTAFLAKTQNSLSVKKKYKNIQTWDETSDSSK